MNILCPICSDLVNQQVSSCVTKCGHIFHYECLLQWIERSNTCPQCRNKVTQKVIFRLYPNILKDSGITEDASTLQTKLDDTNLQLRQQEADLREARAQVENLKNDLTNTEDHVKKLKNKLDKKDTAISGLQTQLEYVKIQSRVTDTLRTENEELKKNLQVLKDLQLVLNATNEEVEQLLQSYTDVRIMASFSSALKRALRESESKKKKMRDQLDITKRELNSYKNKYNESASEIVSLKEMILHVPTKCTECEHKKYIQKHEVATQTNFPKEKGDDHCNDLSLTSNPLEKSSLQSERESESYVSPYLKLKQTGLPALASQYASSKCDVGLKIGKENYQLLSIFRMKELPVKLVAPAVDISFDGLGGHSKLDKFPVPEKSRSPLPRHVPRLSVKHKLKRPADNKDISKMLFAKKRKDN